MPIRLEGIWDIGIAYDLHTQVSIHLGTDEFGHDRFDTTRTPMGELMYQLKYKQNLSVLPEMMRMLEEVGTFKSFDAIIPCPATNQSRPWQPVDEIAKAIGKHFGIEICQALIKDAGSSQIKDIGDPVEREKLLLETIKLKPGFDFSNKKLLLVDDLYQSGSTLSVATKVLKDSGKAHKVCVLTMTKTRR